MKHISNPYHIFRVLFVITILLLGMSYNALAHGKEVEVRVVSLTPDPSQPLTRLYRAEVVFADQDPVENAEISLIAKREEGVQEVGPYEFVSVGEPGFYITEVTYERFGSWIVTVSVTEPGVGEASFTDEIFPGQVSNAAKSDEQETNGGIPSNLAILFKFDWQDFLNIVLRFTHSLAGAAWFGLISVILVAKWFMEPTSRIHAYIKLKNIFGPVAGTSLGILLLSGIYNGIWDAPIRAPGVFNIPVMLAIPFGNAYLVTFLGKLLAYAVLVRITYNLRLQFNAMSESKSVNEIIDSEIDLKIVRYAKVGLGAFVFLAINIAVMIYMHYISHLSVLIPQ